jgi:hypothetical protein
MDLFKSLLSEAFKEDDSLDKSDLFEKVAPFFEKQEVDACLNVLSNECRIMISKDVVYAIF